MRLLDTLVQMLHHFEQVLVDISGELEHLLLDFLIEKIGGREQQVADLDDHLDYISNLMSELLRQPTLLDVSEQVLVRDAILGLIWLYLVWLHRVGFEVAGQDGIVDGFQIIGVHEWAGHGACVGGSTTVVMTG